eukprot:CAMPEP_0197027702 /NCGR_PEP_ID=MMETSP1384-20130603/7567_1 /TAXON_ID=29189 /ORGANISM="Ammonia sp." /LENGTH=652 /DNA_ID=CAMNT_0042456587 /DNA_START=29 /DNA_END=1987 /DNA_ORIENTATION=+
MGACCGIPVQKTLHQEQIGQILNASNHSLDSADADHSNSELNIMQLLSRLSQNEQIDGNGTHQTCGSSQYKLTDLRSLEGVARLWSQSRCSGASLPSLHPSKSTPMANNNMSSPSSNALIPAVSTYFFKHARPNKVLRSHSNKTLPLFDSSPRSNTPSTGTSNRQKAEPARRSNDAFSRSHPNLKEPLFKLSPLSVTSGSESDNDQDELELEIENGLELELELPTEIEMVLEVEEEAGNQPVVVCSSADTETATDVFANAEGLMTVDDFVEYPHAGNIGVGASGIVTKAFHLRSCQMMAIKSCRSVQTEKLSSFRKEIDLHQALKQSEYLVQMIGFGRNEKKNELFIGLEYMDLGSAESLKIHETIKNMKQRELVVGHIAYNIVRGLAGIHEQLYVHNDIKPANLLVNSYGEVKVSDFDTMLKLEQTDSFLYKNNGTQKYQSPEKTVFEVKFNGKTDIWSLGVSCFELLFGANGQNEDEVSFVTNPPRLDPLQHGLSVNCCDFINQCLTVNAEQRPSAKQLIEHNWFQQYIHFVPMEEKWPWFKDIEKKKAEHYYHEDLLFMINCLIQYYGSRKFNADLKSHSVAISKMPMLSMQNESNNPSSLFSDEQRISNMAKYAYCSKEIVMDRIAVTVAYIKAHLARINNKKFNMSK